MAYNQRILDGYRAAVRLQHSPTQPSSPSTVNTTNVHTTTNEGTTSNSNSSVREELVSGPFRSRTCPYCNGLRDATPKYIHPSTKPASPRDFWRHVLCDKYRSVQSARARHNLQLRIPITSTTSSSTSVVGSMQHGDEAGMSPKATKASAVVGHTVSSTTQSAWHDNSSGGDGDENNTNPHAGLHVSDKVTYGEEKMFVVGPMVDQSELPFRMLCREYGATLAYTPMLHAKSYRESALYRRRHFTTHSPAEVKAAIQKAQEQQEEEQSQVESQKGALHDMCSTTDACTLPNSSSDEGEELPLLVDRPCIVQFCGNDPDTVLAAARLAVRGGKEKEENDDEEANCNEAYQEEDDDDVTDKEDSNSDRDGQKVEEEKACSEGQQHDNSNTHTKTQSSHKKSARERYYYCDAVDLNLGCPQGIARRGHYGAFLMEDWELIHTIIHTLHVELEVPVTAKIRVFDQASTQNNTTTSNSDDIKCMDGCGEVHYDEALTVAYARMIRDAGAQLLTVHGRTRAMKGQQTGLANLDLIARIHTALQGSIPVLSNGNVQCYEDVGKALELSHCEGHMCAEALLWDPTLFAQPTKPIPSKRKGRADKRTRLCALTHAQRYLAWLRRCPVDMGCVKAHLYKMCFHSYELHPTLRDALTRLAMHEAANTTTGVCEGNSNNNNTTTILEGVTSKAVRQGECEMNGMSTASHQQEQHEQRVMCDVAAVKGATHNGQRVTEEEEEQQRCAQREDRDEEEEAWVSSTEQLLGPSQLAALEQHLRELYTTELHCEVDLPPVRPAKEKPVDVFAIEESFGIDF